MNNSKISLKAARVNAELSQEEVASLLSARLGIKVSRQRIMKFEENPGSTPVSFAQGLAQIYNISIDRINFI